MADRYYTEVRVGPDSERAWPVLVSWSPEVARAAIRAWLLQDLPNSSEPQAHKDLPARVVPER